MRAVAARIGYLAATAVLEVGDDCRARREEVQQDFSNAPQLRQWPTDLHLYVPANRDNAEWPMARGRPQDGATQQLG